MSWVGWRLQRTETIVAAAILAGLALLLVPTGIQMAHAFSHDGLSACTHTTESFRGTTGDCGDAVASFRQRFESLAGLIAWFTLIPGLTGVLLAAPFVLELENGTYRLAWTQSITRRRWIASKLGLAFATALVAAGVLIVLVTWWRAPLVRLEGRMDNSVFDAEGTVVLGYTAFAFAFAALLGALWRKAVPSLVASFGVYFVGRLFYDTWLRNRIVSPLHVTWPAGGRVPAVLERALVLTEYPASKAGQHIEPGRQCLRAGKGIDPSCLSRAGIYMHAVYQPASRFWEMQGVETALFGGLALVMLAVAAWWTHERVA